MKMFILVAATFLAASASANDSALVEQAKPVQSNASNRLVATSLETKGATVIALDAITDGSVSSMDFRIQTGVSDAKLVDLSQCTSNMASKQRQVNCVFRDGIVYGGFFSSDLKSIEAGSFQIGKITVSGSSAIKVIGFEVTDNVGKALPAEIVE